MERFLFIIREDLSKTRRQTEEERYEDIRIMDEWVKSLVASDNYVFGDGLKPTGKYVSRDNVLSDGPFIESKEAVNGYIFMEAKNIEHAASIAQSCPYVIDGRMAIEIRPVLGLTDIRELSDEIRATGK